MAEQKLKNAKKILDILGYSLVEYNNQWTIVDDNNKAVGYIIPTNVPNKEEYHFVLKSDTVELDYVHSDMFMLTIKDVGTLYIWNSDYPSFNLLSEKYGNIMFYIQYSLQRDIDETSLENSLEYRYSYKVNGYDIDESAHLKNKEFERDVSYKSYGYSIFRKNRKKRYDDDARITFAVTPKNDSENIHVTVKGNYYEVYSDEVMKNKTIEEYAIEDGQGIDLFRRLREFINTALPFKKDLLYELYKDIIDEYGLNILFDEEKAKTDQIIGR